MAGLMMLTGLHQNHASAQIPDKNTLQRFDKQQNDPDYPGLDVWAAGPENPLHVLAPIRVTHLPDFHHRAKYEGPKSASECAGDLGWRCRSVRWDDSRLAMRPGRSYVAVVPGVIPLMGPTSDAWWAPKVTCRLYAKTRAGIFDSPPGVTCIHTPESYEYGMEWVIGGEAFGIDGDVQGVYRGAIPLTVEAADGRWTAVIPVEYSVGAPTNSCEVAGGNSLEFDDVEQGRTTTIQLTDDQAVTITITGGDENPTYSISDPFDTWTLDGGEQYVPGPGFTSDEEWEAEAGRLTLKLGGTISAGSDLATGDYAGSITVSATCYYY